MNCRRDPPTPVSYGQPISTMCAHLLRRTKRCTSERTQKARDATAASHASTVAIQTVVMREGGSAAAECPLY